jgi:hypothetical protein
MNLEKITRRGQTFVYLQHVCPDLHSPVTPIVRHFPEQVTDVSVFRVQVPDALPPATKLATDKVVFVPLPEKQLTPVIV